MRVFEGSKQVVLLKSSLKHTPTVAPTSPEGGAPKSKRFKLAALRLHHVAPNTHSEHGPYTTS